MDLEDYLLSSYSYTLPEERIARYPLKERSASRLLVLERTTGRRFHSTFLDIFSFLPRPVLFVVNDSKVLPARFFAKRSTGATIELLLLSSLPLLEIISEGTYASCVAMVLLKGAKRCTLGEELYTSFGIRIVLLEKKDYGQYIVRFFWDKKNSLESLLVQHGSIPLPPYMKRDAEYEDNERYQSIFADDMKYGSVASPTASLHCSEEFLAKMKEHGSQLSYVTLYVGYGTFSPIRTEDVRAHTMHEEYISIDANNASLIQDAKVNNIPIVAIGTTALRVLESIIARHGALIPCSMMTDLYIISGYQFQCVDALITNFHLPESSLLLLVSAFASRKQIIGTYKEAIEQQYRFFSYGDAMLIL